MLNAELTEYLGYEKNEYTENNENYRNGYSQKTVHSTERDITLNVPRDRQGTFDPIVVEKGQKDISSIEEKIIKMYARGFSNQNIYEEVQELYGVKVSPDMVTAITDKIIPEIREWQKRQLEEQDAIVFVDATYFNVKQDGIVIKKAVYQAPTEEIGYNNLIELEEKWSKRKVSLDNWINNWDNIQPFFKYGPVTRKIMYTTNAIESLNNSYKRLNKGRRVFPTIQSLEKSIYLSTKIITEKWTSRYQNWGVTLAELHTFFPDRVVIN